MGDTTRLTTSGRVQASDGIYVERQADQDLLKVCREGRLGVVLHSRQVGKSSLISHVASVLRKEGFVTASIDFTAFGVHDVQADDWYLAIVDEIAGQLELTLDTDRWWDELGARPPVYKLVRFLADAVLPAVEGPIVVFMDEIDTTLSLPFTDDLFAAIRQCFQRRDEDEAFRRLSFVLVGSSSPTELMKDENRTPFNIGTTIDIRDFARPELDAFAPAFELPPPQLSRVLDWIHGWTGGHPYLTQVLCAAVVDEDAERWTKDDVDELVRHVFLSSEGEQDFNLDNVRDMLTDRWVRQGGDPRALLRLYDKVRRGRKIKSGTPTEIVQHLLLSGVVVADGSHLRVRNRIYAEVFNRRWVRYHMPTNWRALGIGVGAAAAVVVVSAVLLDRERQLRDQRVAQWLEPGLAIRARASEIQALASSVREPLQALRSRGTDDVVAAAYMALLERLHEEPQLESLRPIVEQEYREYQQQRAQALRNDADARVDEDLQAYGLLHAAAAAMLDEDVDPQVVARVQQEYGDIEALMVGHRSRVVDADFSPEGTDLVTIADDATIRRWDVQTGVAVGSPVSTKSDPGFTAAFIGWQQVGAEPIIVALSSEPPFVMLELRATEQGLRRANTLELEGPAYVARVSADGAWLLTAGRSTELLSYPDGVLIEDVSPGRGRDAKDARFSPSGDLIATVRKDGIVQLYDSQLDRMKRSISADSQRGELAAVQFSDDGHWLLTVPFVGTVQVWSVDDGAQLKRVETEGPRTIAARLCASATAAASGPAGMLATVSYDPEGPPYYFVELFEVRTRREASVGATERARITDLFRRQIVSTNDRVLALSPSCTSVVTVADDNLVRVRAIEPSPWPSRSGADLSERWQALFHRTVDRDKVVDIDPRPTEPSSPRRQRR